MTVKLIVQKLTVNEFTAKKGIVREHVASCVDAEGSLEHFVEVALPEGHSVKPQDTIVWRVSNVRVPFAGKVKFVGALESIVGRK